MKSSLVQQAAIEFDRGNFSAALEAYRRAASLLGAKFFEANIRLCENRLKQRRSPVPAPSSSRLPRVAAVMDEFTFHSYEPECELLQLRPEGCVQQLADFQPELLFIESAWKGHEGLWQTKISNNGPEINACLDWCKANGVPTVFWNKEDPVHFGTFLPLAKRVDHVFTTDIDCIPKYKWHVGHERVYLLPFAAQPRLHNPIELYPRKDAFNFAGSYYLRYPERQRDFSALVDAVLGLRPVDIYDRNHENPHPHYTFPDRYKPMILGSLPFAEIDRAYKGYRYGINMNTIKQSQTMFARRVYELLASNTTVVSNFSRGVRLVFGDLVISSDDGAQIRKRVQEIVGDDLTSRKYRLLGLRKVMAEHTYAHRLAYVLAKVQQQPYEPQQPHIVVVSVARTAADRTRLAASFARQRYDNKHLFLVDLSRENGLATALAGATHLTTIEACARAIEKLPGNTLLGVLDPQDHYAANYLVDLALASTWSTAPAFGKVARFVAQDGRAALQMNGAQYRPAPALAARSALVRLASLPARWLIDNLGTAGDAQFILQGMVAVDEFGYIFHGADLPEDALQTADDMPVLDQGVSFAGQLAVIAEQSAPAEQESAAGLPALPQLSALALHKLLAGSRDIQLGLRDGKLHIQSRLAPGKHVYLYARQAMNRLELNLVLQSQFHLECSGGLEARTVFEFQDEKGQKISHQMNAVGEAHGLAIPPHCTRIRVGLRIVGSGSLSVARLVLGRRTERPVAIITKSPYLVIARQYPAYDDLYRYGFLHSRVRAYKDAGLQTELFRIREDDSSYREFDGIDVATCDLSLLDRTLASGSIKHVLVHFLDEKMWQVLKKYIDKLRVTVWIHGAEIQVWQRRTFDFELMPTEEVLRQKKLSDKRKKFWHEIMAVPARNLHFVFVSRHFQDEVLGDLGVSIPKNQCSIIHNFIDDRIFSYEKKDAEARKTLLSIRPYASRKYANDVTVNAILELSKRPFFDQLRFSLYGDGELFESLTEPLKKFRNVKVLREFLSQDQIAEQHKSHGIFLTPTRMDSQGVSRDEAMSSGLVPITTRVAAIPEFVDESCGVVVGPESAVEIADAVERLYFSSGDYLRLSEGAGRRVRMQSGWSSTVGREMKLIANL